ncbi:transporter substrate-binding domain-containing protein [Paucibacter sp. APW11]|uniref:Transporter substrate-binding domain-containing protein n=1 Tax=Roseateles aquae TaxID=3077235 RepID=A0ABU3P9P0_9BURK|nr:transporter substrate-binding domain-containing protein [Paucibacter sp. APW11]MDT8999238.1 transporter substrate-binding domain-containing protein [Paucibacter sp. APW11]
MNYADYRPYSWLDQGRAAGLEPAIASELFKRLGLPVEHRIRPWARAQSEVANGEADGFFATVTTERQQYAQPLGKAVVISQIVAFAHPDAVAMPGFSGALAPELCKHKLAAVRGNGWVKAQLQCAAVQANSTEALLGMLQRKHVELVIEDRLVFRDAAQQHPELPPFREHPLDFSAAPIFFMISKKSALLAQAARIESTLADMQADGSLLAIVRKETGGP